MTKIAIIEDDIGLNKGIGLARKREDYINMFYRVFFERGSADIFLYPISSSLLLLFFLIIIVVFFTQHVDNDTYY